MGEESLQNLRLNPGPAGGHVRVPAAQAQQKVGMARQGLSPQSSAGHLDRLVDYRTLRPGEHSGKVALIRWQSPYQMVHAGPGFQFTDN